MKSAKAVFKSNKSLIVKSHRNRNLQPNTNYGETLIPIGSDDLFVALPRLSNTYTYNIINSDEMSGNITLNTSAGASLRGLVLNTVDGLSIDKIDVGTASITMESDNADGSYISLLSNGDYWYMWSVVSGGSISTGNVVNGGVGEDPAVVTTYADVTVNANPANTVSFPSPQLVARHVLTYQGTAEPNATITITTVATNGGTAVNDFTVTASAIGEWSASFSNILNGTYTFTFTDLGAPAGSGVVSAASDVKETDVGPLSFTTPTSFDLDPGEVFDFAAGASAAEPDGTTIAVTTVSSDFTGKTHGQTFNIVYSFTYLGTPYSRTVSGLVADDTPPSKPVIDTATFDAVNLNELTVTGTTDIGTTLKLYKDITYLGEATVNGAGAWTFTTTIGFNQTFNLRAQANDSATPIVGDNRLFPNYSVLSDPFPVSLNTPTLVRPTLLVTDQLNGVFTNAANDFALTGTTAIGSTITLFNGSTQINPTSGPTVDGAGNWTATITALPESINSLTAKATKAGSNENTSSAFSLNVDRVAPAISGTPLGDLTVYLENIGDNNDSIPTATDFSSTTVSSDWSTRVDAAEGAKTVTYTATDAAGNIATTTRTVNVSTEVIIPAITSVVDNENGTATITGTVTGTYTDNLDVKIYVTDSNGLETVYQENGVDVEFPVNNGTFSAVLTLSSDTYTFHATTINSEDEESVQSDPASQVIIAVGGDNVIPVITLIGNATVAFTVGGSYTDAGATATDDVDGDITSSIVTTIVNSSDNPATLDSTTTAGVYTVRYNVVDSSNNAAATVTRTVTVFAVSSFLEEFSAATNNLAGAAAIAGDVFIRNDSAQGYTYVDLEADGIFSYTNGVRTNIETTLSFWLKFDEQVGAGPNILGWNDGSLNGPDDFAIRVGRHAGGNIQFVPAIGNLGVGTNYANTWTTSPVNNGPTYLSRGSLWNHYALVYKFNGSTYDLKIYINGDVVGTALNKTFEINKNASQSLFGIGAGRYNSISQSVYDTAAEHTQLSLDSIQIADGTALTDSQVTAIAGQSDRLMTIQTAASLHFSSHLEEQGALSGTASLVAGVLVAPGGGDYTSLPMTAAFRSNVNQTISFWFKSTYNPANNVWMRFIHTHVINAGPNGFFIEMRSPRKIYFAGASTSGAADNNPAAIAPYDLNDGAWHQITLSWQDLNGVESLRIWVDGDPMTVLDESLVGSGNDNKTTLFIGARQFNSPMEMDKVGITEEFIDDAEALARYNSEVP